MKTNKKEIQKAIKKELESEDCMISERDAFFSRY